MSRSAPPAILRLCLRATLICASFLMQFAHVPRTSQEVFALPNFTVEKTEAQRPPRSVVGVPRQLSIPSIGVDAPIMPVGLLPGGQLDVPSDRAVVGWYNLNVRPGLTGNAVLDGHLDKDGQQGVFWKLRFVKPGDKVSVTDDRGQKQTFRVTRTAIYPVDNAPMLDIFGRTDGKHLNLITCAGIWRKALNHYDKRLVVYTELVTEGR